MPPSRGQQIDRHQLLASVPAGPFRGGGQIGLPQGGAAITRRRIVCVPLGGDIGSPAFDAADGLPADRGAAASGLLDGAVLGLGSVVPGGDPKLCSASAACFWGVAYCCGMSGMQESEVAVKFLASTRPELSP